MKKQAIQLFIFSFICFIGVFVFGSILGPVKTSFANTETFRNISLFHNHFDQLCWLGSAAVGGTFWVLDHKYKGSEMVLKIFTLSYMLGSLLFSSGFLFRALGEIYDSSIIEKVATIGMISLGGSLIVVTSACALYIVICIIPFKRQKSLQKVDTG